MDPHPRTGWRQPVSRLHWWWSYFMPCILLWAGTQTPRWTGGSIILTQEPIYSTRIQPTLALLTSLPMIVCSAATSSSWQPARKTRCQCLLTLTGQSLDTLISYAKFAGQNVSPHVKYIAVYKKKGKNFLEEDLG